MPAPRSHNSAYQALPGLRWVTADEDYLIFNPLSDEIHRINPLAAAALAELETGVLSIAQLRQRLASLFDTEQAADLEQQLQQVLLQFDDIGLIFPISQPSTNDGR